MFSFWPLKSGGRITNTFSFSHFLSLSCKFSVIPLTTECLGFIYHILTLHCNAENM